MEIVTSDRHAQKIIWSHMKKVGYIKMLDVLVPLELAKNYLKDRIFIYKPLSSRVDQVSAIRGEFGFIRTTPNHTYL